MLNYTVSGANSNVDYLRVVLDLGAALTWPSDWKWSTTGIRAETLQHAPTTDCSQLASTKRVEMDSKHGNGFTGSVFVEVHENFSSSGSGINLCNA